MAKMLARDGEGSTKLIEIEVTGAGNKSDAAVIARKISTSNLLKCCVYGEDPNWGRVVASCGSSGVDFNPDKVDIYLGGMLAFSGGSRTSGYDKNKARRLFKKDEVNIKVDLNAGRFKATAWTCDFTEEYVKINAEYST
jgi:glutamate N-acetyltransferase/amino-acid N-acetyltransferase